MLRPVVSTHSMVKRPYFFFWPRGAGGVGRPERPDDGGRLVRPDGVGAFFGGVTRLLAVAPLDLPSFLATGLPPSFFGLPPLLAVRSRLAWANRPPPPPPLSLFISRARAPA